MHPQLSSSLSISDLARCLSREWSGIRSPSEVFNSLLSALWRADLEMVRRAGHDSAQHSHRERWLNSLAKAKDHPRIVFVSAGETLPPAEVEHPDGSLTIDSRIRITWPPGDDVDKAAAIEAAAEQISHAGLDDYSDVFKPILMSCRITREAFAAYCDRMGLDRPKFWFAKSARGVARASTAKCERWFRERVKAATSPVRKTQLRDEAIRDFNISARQFDEIWIKRAPDNWKAAGRRKKSEQ